jgi:hypothetical protein
VELAPEEYEAIAEILEAARKVQECLWGDMNDDAGLEEFRRMFRKRVAKIEAVSMDNPHWEVELKKRLLQTAAIAVNMLGKIKRGRLTYDGIHPSLPSNLPQFDAPVTNVKKFDGHSDEKDTQAAKGR